ncbi:hypothetical protein VIGAN_08263300 [Vigna angularis var. angularis]|uniref:Uncharacterized protein n=1 Tax=Vigna angularis var. angularis TaxID=157739 RepID=A0A0S3SSI4_PHAAN|nr:hypothetical protein VIGAN_08263300 [Vigna angularis var. angularis]
MFAYGSERGHKRFYVESKSGGRGGFGIRIGRDVGAYGFGTRQFGIYRRSTRKGHERRKRGGRFVWERRIRKQEKNFASSRARDELSGHHYCQHQIHSWQPSLETPSNNTGAPRVSVRISHTVTFTIGTCKEEQETLFTTKRREKSATQGRRGFIGDARLTIESGSSRGK